VKFRTIGRMMDLVVDDLIASARGRIEREGIESVDDARNYGGRIADFSGAMKKQLGLLKAFLMENVYRHPLVVRMQNKAERFVTQLFRLYEEDPRQLPLKYQARIKMDGLERVISDYISGMTDSYCLKEYSRAFEATPYGRMMNP
jgi:dGTPase